MTMLRLRAWCDRGFDQQSNVQYRLLHIRCCATPGICESYMIRLLGDIPGVAVRKESTLTEQEREDESRRMMRERDMREEDARLRQRQYEEQETKFERYLETLAEPCD